MTDKKIKLSNIYIGVTHLSQKGGFYSKKIQKKLHSPLLTKETTKHQELWCFGMK
jgi:hypothetical protein